MERFNIEDFCAGQSYALEAAAGTGKTYNIIKMIRKLLESGISLSEILVVTYTEKAAEELKSRIREEAPEADVDNAAIGTIHSFCQKSIGEFCIATGKPSQLTVIDEAEADDFIRRYIRREPILKNIVSVKRIVLGLDKSESESVEESLIKKFTAIANGYYLDTTGNEIPAIVHLQSKWVGEEYQPIIENYLNGVDIKAGANNKLAEALDTLKGSTSVEFGKKKHTLNDLYEYLKDSQTMDYDASSEFPVGRNLAKFSPDEQKALELINGVKGYFKGGTSKGKLLNYIVVMNAADFYMQWQKEKARRSAQTFNDMIRIVREQVVNGGALLEKLQKKYRYGIIDEFQDTNRKQWDIFSRIFLCEGHNIIVVGDPKQSIYSFQGADLAVYRAAVEEIRNFGGKLRSLPTNYRASESIVKSANFFFADRNALPEEMGFTASDCGKKVLSFRYCGEDKPAYWICDGKKPAAKSEDKEKEKTGSVSREQEDYIRVICQTIADCCTYEGDKTRLQLIDDSGTARNVTFRDFAILGRTREEIKPVAHALEKSGIPYVQNKDSALFTGVECAHWIAILDAVASPNFSGYNRAKFRKVLYTAFFGYSLEQINCVEYDKDSIPEIVRFDSWRCLAAEQRWEGLINSILVDSRLIENLQSLKDMKSLGIFKQIADYCMETLRQCHSLDMLVIKLKNLQKKRSDSDDEQGADITAVSTDFDCVQLMTIHASKGLEFPVVISAAGFKRPMTSVDIYTYHNGNAHEISFEKPDKIGGIDPYDREQTEEWQRLFYVAYTRSKYVLMLPAFNDNAGKKFIAESIHAYIDAGHPYRTLDDNGVDFDSLKGVVEDILKQNEAIEKKNAGTAVLTGLTEQEQRDALKELIRAKKYHGSYKHAYSSLSHPHKKAEREVLTDESLQPKETEEETRETLEKYDTSAKVIPCAWDSAQSPVPLSEKYPAGAGLGNALHAVLELMDYTALVDSPSVRKLIEDSFAHEGFRKIGPWEDDTVKLLEAVMEARLPEIHGSAATGNSFTLSEISFADRRNEVEFNFNEQGQALKNYFNGFIDLLMKRGEYYAVLDWKSDRLSEDFTSYSDAGTMKKHIDELYSIQRVLYSYCLIKWLKNFWPELSEQEIFEQHFGGVYYVCVRGCNAGTGNGLYAQTWENFAALEGEYNKIVRERVGG